MIRRILKFLVPRAIKNEIIDIIRREAETAVHKARNEKLSIRQDLDLLHYRIDRNSTHISSISEDIERITEAND